MLYPYQDKQTLCVTLEDTGEEAISKPVLNIIAFQPLLYVAVIAPLFLFSPTPPTWCTHWG